MAAKNSQAHLRSTLGRRNDRPKRRPRWIESLFVTSCACHIVDSWLSLPMSRAPEPADEVLRTIRKIVRRVSEHSKYLARETGLTMPQLVCLKAIGEMEESGEKEITVVMVSKQVQLSPATVSRIIDRLCRAELVLRERRAKDRRKVCLSLSAAGLDRFHTLPTPLHERFVDRWQALDERDRSQLLDSLRRVTELMDATDIDAAPILAPGSDVKNDS